MLPAKGDPRVFERTPEKVRQLLTECEIEVTRLKGAGPKALTFLQKLDQIVLTLEQLEADGLDVRPERTRLESIINRLYKEGPRLLRELRSVGGMERARAEALYPEAPWWHLDETLREQRRQAWRRRLLVGGPLLIVLAVALFLGNRYLSQKAGGPVAQALVDIERLATTDQNYEAALALAEQLVAESPNEPQAWLWLGMLHHLLGQAEESRAALEKAEALYPSRADFLVEWSLINLRMGLMEDALAAAEQAVQEDPNSAVAYLMLGSVYEALGRREEALVAFQTASDLAEAAGQSELAVNARMRMGYLLMLGPSEVFLTPSPEGAAGE